jgi:ComF family protein
MAPTRLSTIAIEPHIATHWLRAVAGFFYPEVCQLCGAARAAPAEGFVCAGCRGKVRFIEPPFCDCCGRPYEGALTTRFICAHCRESPPRFRFARAAVAARDPVLEVIHHYKYHRALWFEPFLASLLLQRAAPGLAQAGWDMIVPVPLHPVKEREREFNQAERLARRLSQATGISLNTRVVRRILPTRTQTQLNREERERNVRNAFALRRRAALDGEKIVLLDDVMTTGATTNSCAKVLLAGGASEVCVWTVARGI